MTRKLPPEAFDEYVALGFGRSYEAIARKHGVSKRTVTKRAARDGWQARLAQIEAAARKKLDERHVESLEAVTERHLRTLRLIQAKALAALGHMPITSGMDAVRALDLAIKQERVVLGEPGERAAVSVEEVIRREYERWMVPGGAGDAGDRNADL